MKQGNEILVLLIQECDRNTILCMSSLHNWSSLCRQIYVRLRIRNAVLVCPWLFLFHYWERFADCFIVGRGLQLFLCVGSAGRLDTCCMLMNIGRHISIRILCISNAHISHYEVPMNDLHTTKPLLYLYNRRETQPFRLHRDTSSSPYIFRLTYPHILAFACRCSLC